MTATEISTAEIIQAIEAACEDRWGIWLSDTGRWWAARNRSLTVSDFNAGCVPFLRVDSPAELADAIREQDRLCAAIGQPAKENRPASDTPGQQPDQPGLDDLNRDFEGSDQSVPNLITSRGAGQRLAQPGGAGRIGEVPQPDLAVCPFRKCWRRRFPRGW